MKLSRALTVGCAIFVFNIVPMEQHEGITQLKEISQQSSLIAQKCADSFSQECAVLDAMFRHEKERRLTIGKQLTENNAQDDSGARGPVVRNRLRSSYLRGCKTFFICLSEQELQELEEALDELLKSETDETIEKELDYIRSALR